MWAEFGTLFGIGGIGYCKSMIIINPLRPQFVSPHSFFNSRRFFDFYNDHWTEWIQSVRDKVRRFPKHCKLFSQIPDQRDYSWQVILNKIENSRKSLQLKDKSQADCSSMHEWWFRSTLDHYRSKNNDFNVYETDVV